MGILRFPQFAGDAASGVEIILREYHGAAQLLLFTVQLQPELQKIREQGYAVENGEFKVGLRSVSAPVRDATGEVRYAVGVVGMFRQVYSEDFLLATRLVCEAGSVISRAIGYRP